MNYKTVWKTKEGKKIKIKDLTDSHLQNIIAFLERNVSEYKKQLIRRISLRHLWMFPKDWDIDPWEPLDSIEYSIEHDMYVETKTSIRKLSPKKFLELYVPCYKNLVKEYLKRPQYES